jgi:hypothetical protein
MSDKCPSGFYKGRTKWSKTGFAWNKGLTIEDPRVAKNIKQDTNTGRFILQEKEKW